MLTWKKLSICEFLPQHEDSLPYDAQWIYTKRIHEHVLLDDIFGRRVLDTNLFLTSRDLEVGYFVAVVDCNPRANLAHEFEYFVVSSVGCITLKVVEAELPLSTKHKDLFPEFKHLRLCEWPKLIPEKSISEDIKTKT